MSIFMQSFFLEFEQRTGRQFYESSKPCVHPMLVGLRGQHTKPAAGCQTQAARQAPRFSSGNPLQKRMQPSVWRGIQKRRIWVLSVIRAGFVLFISDSRGRSGDGKLPVLRALTMYHRREIPSNTGSAES
jgi:hypothetical protein